MYGIVVYFCGDQIFVDFVGFLSMIIYGSFLMCNDVIIKNILDYDVCLYYVML